MATLKGVFPDPKPTRRKNFIHENVRNLRRMEQFFNTNKEIEELQNVQMRKHQKAAEKYQNITARVNSSFREAKNDAAAGKVPSDSTRDKAEEKRRPNLKASVPTIPLKPSVLVKKPHKNSFNNCPGLRLKKAERGVTNNKHTDKCNPRQGKVPSDPNLCCEQSKENNNSDAPTKYKSRGVQTLDEEHMENLYSEGVIRYPSSRSPRRTTVGDKNESSQQTDKTPREEVNPPSDRGDVCASLSPRKNSDNLCDSPPPGDAVDFIKLNKQRTSVAHKLATQLNHGVAPPNYRKGVVPKYLRERKEAQQQKEREAKEAESHPDCPEGHVPLPDNERKETLRMLKKNYQEFVKELNMMPIKTDTLRSQRRKMEIEKQLNKLEEGIKVFSRPKVYVKVNA